MNYAIYRYPLIGQPELLDVVIDVARFKARQQVRYYRNGKTKGYAIHEVWVDKIMASVLVGNLERKRRNSK